MSLSRRRAILLGISSALEVSTVRQQEGAVGAEIWHGPIPDKIRSAYSSKRAEIRAYPRGPTGIAPYPNTWFAPDRLWPGIGGYFSERRTTSLASDLVQCGPGVYMLFAGATIPLAEAVAVFTLAQCIPNLTADAFVPASALSVVHAATSLLTPWGASRAIITGIAFGNDYILPAADIANIGIDGGLSVRDWASTPESFQLLKDFSLTKDFAKTAAELHEGLATTNSPLFTVAQFRRVRCRG